MIPRLIVQYWDQGDMPEDIARLTKSWADVNNYFGYRCFNKLDAVEFLREFYPENVLNAFLNCALPAMRSDLFRVAFILKFGGVYVDAATCCYSSIDKLLTTDSRLHLVNKWHGGIWNGFIAAEANDSSLRLIFDKIISNIEAKRSNDVWAVTGPGVYKMLLDDIYEFIRVIPQSDLGDIFTLENDLEHKKNNHWSLAQQEKSIFVDTLSAEGVDFEIGTPKIIFHLGPHKTATTTFQRMLERNESLLNRHGYNLVTVRSSLNEQYKLWRQNYTRSVQGYLLGRRNSQQLKKELKDHFSELINNFSHENGGLFVSDENLLGPVPGHFFAKAKGREKKFYSASKIIFEALNEITCVPKPQIILCRRKLLDFLCSSYKDMIQKMSSQESLIEFVDALDPSFNSSYENFYVNVGPLHEIVDFSDFIKNMESLVSALTGIKLRSKIKSVSNPSLSWRAAELAIKVLPSLRDEKDKKDVVRALSQQISGSSKLYDEQLDSLSTRYC